MPAGDRKPSTPGDVRLPRLRTSNMFSNVNKVVEHARLAALGNYRFVIDWGWSPYRDPDRTGEPGDCRFQPWFPRTRPRYGEPSLRRGLTRLRERSERTT